MGCKSGLEKISTPFKDFYNLVGGSLPDASSILIAGDPGSGKTTLAQQILYDELTRSRPCIIVTYDTFPANITERMNEFGWDPRKIPVDEQARDNGLLLGHRGRN